MSDVFKSGFLFVLLCAITTCKNNTSLPAAYELPKPEATLHQLLGQLGNQGLLTVVYHEGDRELMAAAEPELERYFRSRIKIEWVSDMALHPTDLIGKAVLIIGDARHHLLEMLVKDLPYNQQMGFFELDNTTYADPSDVLSMVYPNPVDPKMPLFLLVGNLSSAVYPFLFTPFSKPNIVAFRHSKILKEGAFEIGPEGDWQLDPDHWRSFAGQAKLAIENSRYRIFNYRMAADQPKISGLMKQWDLTWAAAEAFFGTSIRLDTPVDVYLYKRYVDKLRYFSAYDQLSIYGNPTIRHYSSTYREMHIALEAGLDPMGPAHLAGLLAEAHFGQASLPVLKAGLTHVLAPTWGQRGAVSWAKQLAAANWQPSLKQLVFEYDQNKALAFTSKPFAAAFILYLRESWDLETFRDHYTCWVPTREWCDNNEANWQRFLATNLAKLTPKSQTVSQHAPFPPFAKGANHTFEGFTTDRGYLSVRSDAALTHLAEIGANSVALVPFVRAKQDKPHPLLPLTGVNKENDTSIIHAAAHARKLGFAVMLKPQLEGVWPGHIKMNTAEDWRTFFEHYRKMIRHYAVLAEIHKIPALCVGVELVNATKHESFWRDLAQDLRQVYTGKLVYAANWGEEFERITFWDAYDAIGVDCYYPLSTSAAPTDAELKKGAEGIIAKLDAFGELYKKPVWLTEVGFASVEEPWQEPHRDRGKERYDGEAQARCYLAFSRALMRSENIKGVWWWKWHSDGRAGIGDKSFSPQNKPAEEILNKWLSMP